MITQEDSITEGVWNPASRLVALFITSYLAAVFHPVPETIYHWIVGPEVDGNITVIHNPRLMDFTAVPLLGTLLLSTGILAFPVYGFCILCSVLDRWDVRKTTVLGSAVGFSIFFADDVTHSYDLFVEMLVFIVSTVIFYSITLWVSSRIGRQ